MCVCVGMFLSAYVCICTCMYMHICLCLCVWGGVGVGVCVCMCAHVPQTAEKRTRGLFTNVDWKQMLGRAKTEKKMFRKILRL